MVTMKTTKTTKATKVVKKASAPIVDKNTNEKYEEIKKGDMHITSLQKMTIKALQDTAKRRRYRSILASKSKN